MLTTSEVIVVAMLSVGVLFSVLAAVGIWLMTDVYSRMQAASKSVTLGATSIVMAAAVHFGDAGVVARCVLVCVFFFVTVPAASHLLARASHRTGEPLAPETTVDELSDSAGG